MSRISVAMQSAIRSALSLVRVVDVRVAARGDAESTV